MIGTRQLLQLHRDHGRPKPRRRFLHFHTRFVGHPASALNNDARAAQSDLRDYASEGRGRKSRRSRKEPPQPERAAAAGKAKLEVEKAKLELELMRKESDARIAASATAATAAAAAASAAPGGALGLRKVVDDEDDIIGEVPPEVTNICLRFVGLPQEEIVRIFHYKFKAINLYRLRHMQGLRFDALQDREKIGIEGGVLRLKKASGTYKDFGKSIHDVWGEAFINYTAVLVELFGKEAPGLNTALIDFYGKILQLSKVYEWQGTLLPMAIEVHTYIISQQPSDPSKWVISSEFQGRFCTPLTMIGMDTLLGGKRRRSGSPPTRRTSRSPGGVTNNPSVTCEAFKKGSCGWPSCERTNKCKSCGSKEHGQANCSVAKGKRA